MTVNHGNQICELTRLADKYGTDKGSEWFERHKYTELYASLFHQLRYSAFTLIELGVSRGAQDPNTLRNRRVNSIPSIEMWLEYFPHASVVGFDLADLSDGMVTHDRFSIVKGDVGSADDLDKLNCFKSLRIVIDDASHASFHQQFAFSRLFPLLERGGFYAIEDLHWKPRRYEKLLPACTDTAEVFLEFIRTGRFKLSVVGSDESLALGSQIINTFVFPTQYGGQSRQVVKLIIVQKT